MGDMVKNWTIKNTVFEYIPIEDIRITYNTIEADLKRVMTKTYTDWIPADVYAALRNGSSELYLSLIHI